jgi:hypothetical protein
VSAVRKRREVSWLGERLSDFQEVLYTTESVNQKVLEMNEQLTDVMISLCFEEIYHVMVSGKRNK